MTGLFACECRSIRPPKGTVSGRKLEPCGEPCADGGKALSARVKDAGLDGAVIVGCQLLFQPGLVAALAGAARLPSSRLLPVALSRKGPAGAARRSIGCTLAALHAMQPIETRRVKMDQRVLVVGEGAAAREAAGALAALGHPVASVSRLSGLAGFPGAFTAEADPGGLSLSCGAVVLATMPAPRLPPTPAGARSVALGGLLDHLAALRRRQLPRSLCVLLDLDVDEGIASGERAFHACLEVRSRFPSVEATLALRDAKVSALALEKLYDEVREAGVAILKHAGRAMLGRDDEGGVTVRLRDEVLGAEVTMRFDLVALSDPGTASDGDRDLAALLGLGVDPQGQVQDDNVRLLPGRTARPGIFVVGACRGESWEPNALRDAAEAAAAVHESLDAGGASGRGAIVELAHAVVDGEKCALCLTCIRSCPARAMRILAEEQRADCIPEACRRCGICAGECPSKAIRLPAWSGEVVAALAGLQGAAR